MCRLLGYVSDSDTDFPSVVGENFEEFVKLSKVHCDGWGITDKSGDVYKEATPAYSSPDFMDVINKTKTDGSLLHIRWATSGLPVNKDNAHPFHFGKYSFIHNGSINPPTAMDSFIAPAYLKMAVTGNDSERYFLLVIQKIEELGLVPGIKAAVKLIKEHADFSSINAFLMSPTKMIVISEHDNQKRPDFGGEDYYDLHYREDDHAIVVASSGWNQEGWHQIPNHTMMVIDRHDRSFETAKL
jgi:predicted glutamine amidotransferase